MWLWKFYQCSSTHKTDMILTEIFTPSVEIYYGHLFDLIRTESYKFKNRKGAVQVLRGVPPSVPASALRCRSCCASASHPNVTGLWSRTHRPPRRGLGGSLLIGKGNVTAAGTRPRLSCHPRSQFMPPPILHFQFYLSLFPNPIFHLYNSNKAI